MSRIRIAFVASTYVIAGAERVMFDVITRLPHRRFDTRLYFLRDAGPMGRELIRAGIPAIENLQHGRLDPVAGFRLLRHFRRFRPDVVFCLDHHNAMLHGRLAGILTGARARVIASHSTGLFGRKGSFSWSDRLLMDFTERVVAISASHARYLVESEGVDPGRIVVIENGIDVDAYARNGNPGDLRGELGVQDDESVVMMVAALRPEKAHEALLEAVMRLRRHRRIRALVVGEGARREYLEALTRRMGLEDNVTFLGLRRDVARILQVADVVVLPSHGVVETLPLSLLEAMAAGVPVVASRVGSIPDLIEDGTHGLLIDPADGKQLAGAIGRIIDDTELSAKLARNGRERVVSGYSADRMAREYQEMFEELVA